MKQFISVIILSLVAFICNAQMAVSPQLQSVLHDNASEYVDINIFFESENPISALEQILDKNHASFDVRVKSVISLQKENFRVAYAKFMEQFAPILNSDPKAVEFQEGFWIANVLNMKIRADYVYTIAEFDIVKFVDYNAARYRIMDAVEIKESAPRSVGGVEWGVENINAPAMWALNYTGRNVLFLSIDTGVNPEHPAISENFAGNNMPMSQCWYGMRHDMPRDNASSCHGTHTTGTSLGLDRNTADTIGVAYNAKWIACDPVASTTSELLTISQFFSVYQWVLNPDGDENTTHDVPRVINNSWGYDYTIAEEVGACSLPEGEILQTLEIAGIASPFSAGNEGPNPQTTGFPAMLAYNLVNPMAVAAVNSSNVVASFSSHGPTPCVDEETSLKIKPEVSAPGVNVRSCIKFDAYGTLSGTSMACPHVSGALLLLAEAFPMASAKELKEALYYSAIDLGDEGEDNVYGMGFIDVFAAYNYLSSFYTPVPPVTDDYDIAAEMIVDIASGASVTDYTCIADAMNLNVKVVNKGTQTAENVSLKVYSGIDLICDTAFVQSIPANDFIQITLNNVPTKGGLNEIRAVASLNNNETEMDVYNNSRVVRHSRYSRMDFPYLLKVNDETSLSQLGILIQNDDMKKTWKISPWGENDEQNAIFYSFNKNTVMGDTDYIYLPQVEIPENGNSYINFVYAYQRHRGDGFKDTVRIEISTDCGRTFDHLVWENGGPSLYTVEGNAGTFFKPISYEQFDTISINISEFAGQDVVIRFAAQAGFNSEIYIDELSINQECQNNGIEKTKFDDMSLQVYPNPSNGQFNIVVPENSIGKEMFIYDLCGRQIAGCTIKSSEQTVDMSGYNAGIYFIGLQDRNAFTKIILMKN